MVYDNAQNHEIDLEFQCLIIICAEIRMIHFRFTRDVLGQMIILRGVRFAVSEFPVDLSKPQREMDTGLSFIALSH